MPRTILLIDGDQYLHRACAAVERDERWDDENHVLYSNEVEAWEVVDGSIEKVLAHFGEKDHVVCLSEGEVFRKKIDPSYKASRSNTRKPLCFFDLKGRLKAARKCVFFHGLEADDVMGILATKPSASGDKKIIVAQDKDMKTIPGMLWDGYKFYNITEEQADYFHLYQTLVGDTADGYKGCPGIGPKKAEKLLQDAAWPAVVDAYRHAGLTEADALRNARLARILRWTDWESATKTPILWCPRGAEK